MMNLLQPRTLLNSAATTIFALLIGAAISAGATEPPKSAPKAPPKPAAAPKTGGSSSSAPKTGGSSGGGASHTTTTGGGSHPGGITTGGSHTTTGGTTGGSHTTTGGSTGGSHTTTTGGMGGKTGGTGGMGGKSGGTGVSHATVGGYGRTPTGATVHTMSGGRTIVTRPGGHVATYSNPARGASFHNNMNGGYHGAVFHPDHSGVYFAHGRAGYYQRPYGWHGHDFGRRSYYWHGHPYYGYYHGWGWRGGYYNVYAPGFFFGAGFYGWAYNPWYHPIGWGWGWGGNPWYGYYGGWWNPYPTYAAPAFWLTDYIISQNLQAAYAAHQEGGEQAAAGGGGAVLSPEVKDEIAEEVRAQIALENAEAQQTAQGQAIDPGSSGIGRLMTDGKHHIFVAASALDVVDAGSGQECAISDGDVLQLAQSPGPDATSANLVVLASKGGNECGKASTVTVNFSDLQEMQNSMRMNLDNGLKELQAKQGTGGIPPAPPSAKAAPTEAPYAAVAPPPEPGDEQQIQQQEQQTQQEAQQAQGQQ